MSSQNTKNDAYHPSLQDLKLDALQRDILKLQRRQIITGAAAASLLAACGGGSSPGSAPSASASPQPGPTPAPADPSATPVRVVIEDHRDTANVRDVGVLTLTTALGSDSFSDARLKTACSGWQEFGRAGTPVVFEGIEFDAWRFALNADGIYAGSAAAHRVLVLMRATDLTNKLFGNPNGKRTYAPPFKLRIESAAGGLLRRVEMRDGLPINDASLPQDPRLTDSQVMRRHVCAGMALPVFFGPEPFTPKALQDRLPRAKTGALAMPSYLPKYRAIVNGGEMMVVRSGNTGSNGNAHPYVMPRWAMSRNQMNAQGILPTNDAELVRGNSAQHWESALVYGWDYEPGAYGGITNRGGPGGIRGDRAAVPPEFLQMLLTAPAGARAHDGVSHETLTRAFLRNAWNYGTYRHAGQARLSPIDALSFPFKPPATNLNAESPRPQIVAAYYNRGNTTFEDPVKSPNAIWAVDGNGENDGPIWEQNKNPLDNRHATGGWCPEGEHANRLNGTWGTWLFADPIYARMQEFLLSEVAMDYPTIDQSVTATSYIPYGLAYFADGGEFPDLSRTQVLRWINLVAMWATATDQGTYTRALCEERLRAIAVQMEAEFNQKMPANNGTVDRLAWRNFAAKIVWNGADGWCLSFPISSQYLAECLMLMKSFGLWDVLRNQGTPAQRAACTYLQDKLLQNIRNIEEHMVANPWHVSADNGGGLLIPMRSPAQGAVETDVSTVPTSWAQIRANTPTNPRSDGVWHLKADGSPNPTSVNFVRNMSLKIAFAACEYGREKSDPLRATNLNTLTQRAQVIDTYVKSRTSDPAERVNVVNFGMLLHAWPQSVPALDV
jgi:hypothetical protein